MTWFCGCCGGALDQSSADWCSRCRPHVSTEQALPAWERTYLAQHGVDCPHQLWLGGEWGDAS